jgi:superfamily II DNA/RNA helicase
VHEGPSHEDPAQEIPAQEVELQTFADLGVRADICEALQQVGIVHPFPIQELAIPIAINGTDLIGQARTGTGKTLAFGITLLERIVIAGDPGFPEVRHPDKPQALVMCPTRELAIQVAKDIATAASVRGARVLTVYGGVGYETQLDTLASGVDVVVGTPGRLLDLAQRRSLDLSHVRVLVLDEADEMLDLGFLPDVEKLIGRTPKSRQTMMFSATMPSAIVALARANLNNPINVRAETNDAQATVPDTTQFVYQAHDLDKPEILSKLLQSTDVGRTMVFTRTKRAAQRIADDLVDRGFKADAIHGDLNQVARERALKKFRSGSVQVLVATDVAARGIDVADVTHVVNYECPDDEKTYIHRIGRTGRAGAKGIAVTLVDWQDITRWKLINKALHLPFEDLVETYSTSAHLFTDLQIPEGTRGRLGRPAGDGDPSPRRRSERSERGDRAGRNTGDRPAEKNRSRGSRQRRRTRGGVPAVEAEATPTPESA